MSRSARCSRQWAVLTLHSALELPGAEAAGGSAQALPAGRDHPLGKALRDARGGQHRDTERQRAPSSASSTVLSMPQRAARVLRRLSAHIAPSAGVTHTHSLAFSLARLRSLSLSAEPLWLSSSLGLCLSQLTRRTRWGRRRSGTSSGTAAPRPTRNGRAGRR